MEHLDRYEGEGLDDGFLEDVTLEEQMAGRRAAELVLERRDAAEGRLTGRRRILPAALEGASVALRAGAAQQQGRAGSQEEPGRSTHLGWLAGWAGWLAPAAQTSFQPPPKHKV